MAEKKVSTLDHLKELALKGKAYSAARISELAALVAAGLEDTQHTGITVTLPAANWSGRAQTVQNESLLVSRNYWYFIFGDDDIKADDITVDGEVTFHCEIIPENDLTVNILRLEVET